MIDFLASERHFIDHLAPVYRALPVGRRGTFWCPFEDLRVHAAARGVSLTIGAPTEARPTIVASMIDIKRYRGAHTNGPLAFLEHGVGQSYGTNHSSYAGGKDRDDVGLFLVPNPRAAKLWQDAYPDAEVRVIPSPHLADLPPRDHSLGPTVCISFHNDMPTGNGYPDEMRSAFHHYRHALSQLIGQPFNIIGHAHPRFLANARRYYRRTGIVLVEDFEEVCRRADLYVCDNSSTIFEFAATGRPVVLLNAPWYDRRANHGLRFWSESDVGMQVDEPEDLLPAIRAALADPHEQREKRFAAVRRVFPKQSVPPDLEDARSASEELVTWARTIEVAA